MTGILDHARAPLLETLAEYAERGIYPFHTPGHKGGRFAAPELVALVGKRGLSLDLPAMTATDNTFHPTGPVREAQALAADLFGAAETFYLSAGSTLGVATALLAAVGPGQTVALPRNIHRSVVAGLVLSGALPRFIPHDVLPECGALGVTAEQLERTLDAGPPGRHGDSPAERQGGSAVADKRPAAVLLTRPSYYGLARELGDIVTLCRARRIPLIVDEAHGAHFHFLPSGCPQPALACGADLVVQSCHKTLGSLVGSAQLHVGHDSPIDAARVRDALNFLQTTSPSYLLMASLDAMRRWLWREGRTLFADAVDEAQKLAAAIDSMPGLRVLHPEEDRRLAGHRGDPLRLVVNVSGTGWTGYEVERFLRSEFLIEDEMADWFSVVYVLSPQDDPAARKRLVAGLNQVSGVRRQVSGPALSDTRYLTPDTSLLQPPPGPLAMAPREAALGRKTIVALNEAAGRVCAEMLMFYPPGIPLLMPGELVTTETVEVCRHLMAAGAHPYASDPSLDTIRVVA